MPAAWPEVFQKLNSDPDRRVRSAAYGSRRDLCDATARQAFRLVLADGKAPLAPRREALAALLQAKDPVLAATLHSLVTRPRMGAVPPFGHSRPMTIRRLRTC